MKTLEKVIMVVLLLLLAALLGLLGFMFYDVSTTTCLEQGTIKRIVSVDGNSNRAVVELTDGSRTILALGHITEYQIVCKKHGRSNERTN